MLQKCDSLRHHVGLKNPGPKLGVGCDSVYTKRKKRQNSSVLLAGEDGRLEEALGVLDYPLGYGYTRRGFMG